MRLFTHREAFLGGLICTAALFHAEASAEEPSAPPASEPAPVEPPTTMAGSVEAGAASAAQDGGDDTGDIEALLGESVVTTASRSAERATIAPSTVFNITAAEIRQSGVRTVDEALEFLGLGIYVAKPRDFATGMDVGAQGLLFRDAGRHVLVLLDGLILNSQGTGRISLNEALGVPLDFIDHIEVMLGPGSVMYGSNAMLAVVNIITKPARALPSLVAQAEVGTALAQDDAGAPTLAQGTRPGIRGRFSLGAAHKFRLGGRDGELTAMLEWNKEQSNSYGVTPFSMGAAGNQSLLPGQETWGGAASHDVDAINGAASLKFADFRLLVNAFGYARTMPLVGTFNDPDSREAQAGVRIDLSHELDIGSKLVLDSRVYGGYARLAESSDYGEDFWCITGQDNGCHFELSARSGWLGLEQKLATDWRADGIIVTTVGYDVRLRWFDSTPADYTDLLTSVPPTEIELPHSTDTTVIGALFVQQVWRPLDWLNLNVGARLDIDSDFGAKISPRAAVVFTRRGGPTLRVSYNEAFRAPSRYEITEFDPTYRITPTELRPETVRSLEAELQHRIWRLTVSLRGYASWYDDVIESRAATADEVAVFTSRLSPTVDPENVIVNDNITSLRVLGGSARAQLQLPMGFGITGAFNWARATIRGEDGEDTTYVASPEWFGNFRAWWQSGDEGYSVNLVGVYASSRQVMFSAAPTEFTIDPRLDLRLTAAGPIGLVTGLRFRATVGFDVNPELPYAVATGTDTPKTYVTYPDASRLFAFVGLEYQYGSAK